MVPTTGIVVTSTTTAATDYNKDDKKEEPAPNSAAGEAPEVSITELSIL